MAASTRHSTPAVPFRPISDTVPTVPKNCPINSRNPVRIKSEQCPNWIGMLSELNWNHCPISPGIRILGLVPAPVDWEGDITAMYLAKLKQWRKLPKERYHLPLEGSKVFIRVWQQVNGWENQLGMFQASALVPAERDRGLKERGPGE